MFLVSEGVEVVEVLYTMKTLRSLAARRNQ
jgi:hypothetical protein